VTENRPEPDREPQVDRLLNAVRRIGQELGTPGTRFGHYRIIGRIGAGGAAIVYRARDTKLDRDIALKILPAPHVKDEAIRKRFLREARAAGTLDHPHLVSVYDVGEERGQPYIVMELVEGASLGETMAAHRKEIPYLAGVLEKVARGVGKAHEGGVVHRDLKPGNVLITPAGEPKVGDFGLAHLMESETRLTKTGTVLGTPLYMAPEQVKGKREEITPRTDVYSLGVILYEMLTGRPPHLAETAMELYGKLLNEEPLRPGVLEKDVPKELEAICLKAIDKDRERRYADATELAEDLKRFLEGRPVGARHPTFRYRIWKRMRPHRTAWTLGAAAALAGAAAIVVAAMLLTERASRSDANERTVQAERMYDAQRYEETRRLAQEALAIVPDLSEARYWLRRLKIREYQALRGVPEARVVRGLVEVIPPRPETEKEKALRSEIERELEAPGARPLEKGILALWDGRHGEALGEFAKVRPDTAGAWEAELYSATAHYLRGEFEEAKARLTRHRGRDPAVTAPMWIRTLIALAQARERTGKDPWDLYEQAMGEADELGGNQGKILEARALVAWGRMEASRGKNPERRYSLAIGLVGELEEAEAHLVRGDAWMARAEFRDDRGRLDPAKPAEYEEAVRAYGAVAEGHGLLRRAEAYLAWGEHLRAHALPRREQLDRALEDYRSALAHNPKYADAAIGLARTEREISTLQAWQIQLRGDTEEYRNEIVKAYATEIEALGKLIREHESYAPAYFQRGTVHRTIAGTLDDWGEDPREEYLAAIADLDRAVGINPKFTAAYNMRGLSRQDLGMHRWGRGLDPRKEFAEAIDDFGRAAAINPLDADTYLHRGLARQNLAGYLERIGKDPIPEAEAAIGDFGKAIEIKPDMHAAFYIRGLGFSNLGVYLRQQGKEYAPSILKAIEDLNRALELKPGDGEALRSRGLAHQSLAMHRWRQSEDARPEYRAAIGDFDLCIEKFPDDGEAHRLRGWTRSSLAQYLEEANEDPRDEYEAAIKDYGRAVEINPRDAAAHSFCAQAWEGLARRLEERGANAMYSYREAVEQCSRALKIRPDFVMTRFRRGSYYLKLGRKKEALADLERAVELRPSLKEKAEPLIRKARGGEDQE
jgi:tetratricopeptide (TPR) repeat protein/tRNA A-37 threonylcarbamoyl transferase component Bud32